jgi:predicted DNA binding protein
MPAGAIEKVSDPPHPEPRWFRRLTDGQVDRLVEGYASGRTVHQLATEFGVTRQTVSQHLGRRCVAMSRQGIAAPDRA